jgi:hypothetical protein
MRRKIMKVEYGYPGICPEMGILKRQCGCLKCQRLQIDVHFYETLLLLDKRMTTIEEKTDENILLLVNSIERINEAIRLLSDYERD